MTDTYKATTERWEWQASKRRAANGHITDFRLLELQARIEQLEAQTRNYPEIPDSSTPPPVAKVTRDRDETGNYVIVHDTATPPKAVMDAFLDSAVDAGNYYATRSHQIAAALRAAAMRTLLTSEHYEGSTPNDYELGWNAAVAYIQNIATELEGP